MDTITVFAVCNEGRVPFIDADPQLNGKPHICVTSYWLTEPEAQFAIDRVFSKQMGTWTPKRRWVEEREITDIDLVSELAHNGPEYATR